ncbi:hypothetical protein ADIMK_1719 [Marinobacterium lacunae]|uniref:Uncharacterized protein n=1 Tax=Marinobacterium lacunae TaxID=1232683 RepID=A0A081FZM9_9GAMM|nr:hypothetical protein ADIMK_1719 [Marinobacterium lacunae]
MTGHRHGAYQTVYFNRQLPSTNIDTVSTKIHTQFCQDTK